MFAFISNLWKKRNVNRTQSRVLGDSDEVLMCLPSDTAAWVVAKFNEMTGALEAREQELKIAQKRILVLSQALDEITEAIRPFVTDGGVYRRVFNTASAALKV